MKRLSFTGQRLAPRARGAWILAAALALVVSSCIETPEAPRTTVPRGGTLRVSLVTPFLPVTMDPQTEYQGETWELLRCCLVRTLLSYPGRPTGRGGAELRPDLAGTLPDVSPDGLTWTFRLKRGLRHAPPFTDNEIIAQDLVRALERVARVGQDTYAFYYTVIEGFSEVMEGEADSITGLETPDDHTLVIHLTEPTGDLGHRLALPAVSPIPPDPTGALLGAADGLEAYGRYLVASGPYMIEGSEDLDFSVAPGERQPVSGFKPDESITLVRNPSWRRRSDRLRPAYVDRIEIGYVETPEEAAKSVAEGESDVVITGRAPPQVPPEILEEYRRDPALSKLVTIAPRDLIAYATMNLAQPPFDDVHVRKAVNYAIDKAAFLDIHSQGDSAVGQPMGHAILDSLLNNLLLNYDPYATPGSAGDLDRARQEMAQSRYDHDGDGVCDDAACRNLSALAVELEGVSGRDEGNAFASSLAGLGIRLDVKVLEPDPFFKALKDPRRHVALGINAGWLKDFPAAGSFVTPLFSRAGLDSCCNYSLIGATPEELLDWGYKVTSVPSVEEKVRECHPLIGADQVRCWAELDQQVMEQVVPWVPLLVENTTFIVSRRVVATSFDQFATLPALEQTAVASQP
jgi:peptide/nickel transport system substrate-binding protein